MIMQAEEKKLYTPEEYLEYEVNSEERHEYIGGEVVPVTGGTPNHNQIAGNFYAALHFALKRQPYRVFVTDQRVWIPKKQIYAYPDVMVVQGDLQLQSGQRDTVTNPLIIAEVLSDSTRNYDKDKKFSAFRTIPSFVEYLLIDQYTVYVEQYFKTGQNSWTFSEYYDVTETVTLNSISLDSTSLDSIPFEITLADIYDKVDFEDR